MAITSFITKNKQREKVKKKKRRYLFYWIVFWPIAAVGLFFVFSAYENNGSQPIVALISVLLFFYLFFKSLIYVFNSGDPVLIAGAEGEDRALHILKRLPKSYYLFNQLEFKDPKSMTGTRETDFVVVGPNGIFIIEVKNISGQIKGTELDKNLLVLKSDRWGNVHQKEMHGNPFRQIKKQLFSFQKFINNRCARSLFSVQGLLLFVNPNCYLNIDNHSTIPAYQDRRIIKYIKDFEGKLSNNCYKAMIVQLSKMSFEQGYPASLMLRTHFFVDKIKTKKVNLSKYQIKTIDIPSI